MTQLNLRHASLADVDGIYHLYLGVSKEPGGIARLESEVHPEYIQRFVSNSINGGLILIAERGELIVGEIHAYTPGLFCLAHVLSELTIAIAPEAQGQGVGRALFQRFMNTVVSEMPTVLRVELIARESNAKAISFYKSLGFQQEGCFNQRIRNLDGTLESDIPMAWNRGKGCAANDKSS
jgi:ribosomal protein S18 acetylase RimI-like enzyme